MKHGRAASRFVALTGSFCLIAAAVAALADPGQAVRGFREAIFDRLLVWSPRVRTSDAVMVVDIGRDTLAQYGSWPWPRGQLAVLIDKIADAKPRVLAIDILLAPREPADPGDEDLARALTRVPTVLAAVLDPEPGGEGEAASSVAVSGEVSVPGLLSTPGVVLPAPALAESAQGLGVISLPVSEGKPVRAVPLLAGGGETVFAGLAAETLRVADGGVTIIAAAPPQMLRIGERALPLPADALMRLHFGTGQDRAARTLQAEALMPGEASAAMLAGKIVFLGASAPEAGGLRLTAADPFMPSVQVQADATDQMLTGHILSRDDAMDGIEVAAGVVLGILGILAVIFLPPGQAAMTVLALVIAWMAAAVGLTTMALRLTDPATPVIIALFAIQGAGLAQFGVTYRQRLAIERRFALRLPPEVVRRIAENPSEIKLAGETRVITALFTDIEDFTALTERMVPEALVSLLDRYVDTVAGIIVSHGGMVDKIVGDAVHAFFNAPLDLPDHAEKAVAAAIAIIKATEALRHEPEIAGIGFGRTRIGIETGQAILGDVGRGAKRDYTAYGHAVNLASRLEAANKGLGSSIAIGPGTVAALGGRMPLRRIGCIPISGIDAEVEIFEPEF